MSGQQQTWIDTTVRGELVLIEDLVRRARIAWDNLDCAPDQLAAHEQIMVLLARAQKALRQVRAQCQIISDQLDNQSDRPW